MGAIRVEPLDAAFGAAVHDVNLAGLTHVDGAAPDVAFREIHDAWLEYGLLIFPGQHLAQSEQDEFARRFGDLEFTATALTNIRRDGTLRIDPDHDFNKSLRGNEGWHHDSTYMPVQAKGAVFTAETIPSEGGATGFADMRAAHDALSAAQRTELDGLAAHHSRKFSMERAGHVVTPPSEGGSQLYGYDDIEPPLRPVVAAHPATGRPNLVIGQHAHRVVDVDRQIEMGRDQSLELLDRLNADATAARFTHHHEWTVGDAVLWDNRRLMHRATPHDLTEPRRMWHTRIAGDPATDTALNHR